MGCGFFSLLLRSNSGASWSAPLVHPLTQWLGAAAGADCTWLPVSHGGFWKNFLFYVPFVADACFAWFNSGYMFYGRLVANFTYFSVRCTQTRGVLSPFRRMEKCAQLMLRVAVSLRAIRTLNLDIISTSSPWWRCWVFDAFCVIFRAPPVDPELSASFSSFRVFGVSRIFRTLPKEARANFSALENSQL